MRPRFALCVALMVALVALIPGLARAQEISTAAADQPTRPVSTREVVTGGGVVLFGVSYLPALAAGSSAHLDADRQLLLPLVGPWLDLARRPACVSGGRCGAEATDRLVLATDGIAQAVAVISTLGGLLAPARASSEPSAAALGWHLAPTAMGSGYGVKASGAF